MTRSKLEFSIDILKFLGAVILICIAGYLTAVSLLFGVGLLLLGLSS